MSHQFVAYVRLRCVHGLGMVADVLGGVEHTERQPSQEISRGQQTWEKGDGDNDAYEIVVYVLHMHMQYTITCTHVRV